MLADKNVTVMSKLLLIAERKVLKIHFSHILRLGIVSIRQL